jgi:hypothetical protein
MRSPLLGSPISILELFPSKGVFSPGYSGHKESVIGILFSILVRQSAGQRMREAFWLANGHLKHATYGQLGASGRTEREGSAPLHQATQKRRQLTKRPAILLWLLRCYALISSFSLQHHLGRELPVDS